MPSVDAVARRMARALEHVEGSHATLYFAADGKRLATGGRAFYGTPREFAFCIAYPFRPSIASLADMIREHRLSSRAVTYDQTRWEADPRIEEQAGPSILGQLRHEQELEVAA
jgi:hypothetical protein